MLLEAGRPGRRSHTHVNDVYVLELGQGEVLQYLTSESTGATIRFISIWVSKIEGSAATNMTLVFEDQYVHQ